MSDEPEGEQYVARFSPNSRETHELMAFVGELFDREDVAALAHTMGLSAMLAAGLFVTKEDFVALAGAYFDVLHEVVQRAVIAHEEAQQDELSTHPAPKSWN